MTPLDWVETLILTNPISDHYSFPDPLDSEQDPLPRRANSEYGLAWVSLMAQSQQQWRIHPTVSEASQFYNKTNPYAPSKANSTQALKACISPEGKTHLTPTCRASEKRLTMADLDSGLSQLTFLLLQAIGENVELDVH